MIAMLRGRIARRGADWVVVDVGGVGYRVAVPGPAVAKMPAPGGEVVLHVHTHVREDTLALFGFLSEDELRLFEQIVAVTGMGPRLALTALSTLSPDEFRRAVLDEDAARLTRIPGVGRKTAQRIILELKGRLPAEPVAEGPVPAGDGMEDALAALVSLGYGQAEAADAIRRAARDAGAQAADPAHLVRVALRHLDSLKGDAR
ncbi:MAG: Holliday junction branch migration protein RuvA [Firmicutes bacterium]|nr:Holliday junction branch migration protein RuvA [Bacillota bacterium]